MWKLDVDSQEDWKAFRRCCGSTDEDIGGYPRGGKDSLKATCYFLML